MQNKLVPVPECVSYVNEVVRNEAVSFCFVSDAPFLVRLLSRGDYSAYKNVVYVPRIHFDLATSANEYDRTIATAKLLPWIMAIKDRETRSLAGLFSLMNNVRKRSFYFLYEYGFLKFAGIPYADQVYAGFISTRRKWLGLRRVDPADVVTILNTYLADMKKPS